jgi:hypothetical protein
MTPLTLALVARIPVSGVADFQSYEAQVLPLLGTYGGTLQRRLRNADGTVEIHVVRFDERAGLERFRGDPGRAAAANMLERSGAAIELWEMNDVDDD